MAISVTCGQCGTKLRADPQHAGKRAKCPKCGGVLEIPGHPDHPEQKGAEADAVRGPASTPSEERAVGPDPSPVGAPGAVCPECGAGRAAHAVLCIQCGLDFRTGRKLVTRTDADAPPESVQGRAAEGLADGSPPGSGGTLVVVRRSERDEIVFPKMCIGCLAPDPERNLAVTWEGWQMEVKTVKKGTTGETLGIVTGGILLGGGFVGAAIGGALGSHFDRTKTEMEKTPVEVSSSLPICGPCLTQVTKKHRLGAVFCSGGDSRRDVASNLFLSGEIEEGYLLLTFASVAYAEAFREANAGRVLEPDAARTLFRPRRLPRGPSIGRKTPPIP